MKIHLQPSKPPTPLILARQNAWSPVSAVLKTRTRMAHKYPTKCTGKSGSREKQCKAIMVFASLVPHAQIEDNSWEESTLCDAQEEADDEKSREIASDAHEGTNDAPYEGEGRKPKLWSCELEDDVEWDLGQDVADKVDGQRGEVLVSG